MLQRIAQEALERQLAGFHAAELPATLGETADAPDPARRALDSAVVKSDAGRRLRILELPEPQALRTLAGDLRQHTLDHLDHYLEQFVTAVEKRGGTVHFATDAAAARRIVLSLASGKSHAVSGLPTGGDEVGIIPALATAGVSVSARPTISSAAGSFALDLSRRVMPPAPVASSTADLALVAGTFLIAETGGVCVVDNGGAAAQALATGGTLVCVAGIEKVVPRQVDLTLLLKLLARSAAGQAMTAFTSLIAGPRSAAQPEGPAELHVVLLDNGRSEILADAEYRETLRCVSCGACLHACPVYRKAGGTDERSRDDVAYPGPIGAVMTPLLTGMAANVTLPQASTLCGACGEACPVKIDLPRYLVRLRRDAGAVKLDTVHERAAFRVWSWLLHRPRAYRFVLAVGKWRVRRAARRTGYATRVPFPAGAWGKGKNLPAPAKQSFHALWEKSGRV